MTLLLYLDQNYLSGFAKGKPAFGELHPVLRTALAAGVVAVVESSVHERESRPRPDLDLLELLRELSGGRRLPSEPDNAAREVRRRLAWTVEHELPERRPRGSDVADLDVLRLRDRLQELMRAADVERRAIRRQAGAHRSRPRPRREP